MFFLGRPSRQMQEHTTVRYLYEARSLESSMVRACANRPFPGESEEDEDIPPLSETLRSAHPVVFSCVPTNGSGKRKYSAVPRRPGSGGD